MNSTSAGATASGNAREIVTRFLESKHADLDLLADGVVFVNMATGDKYEGRDAASGMLHYMYHLAFDADAEIRRVLADGNVAVVEADFVGKHIGEFIGIPPTDKHVRVPLCVVYDVADGRIRQARIYFEVPALMAQLQ